MVALLLCCFLLPLASVVLAAGEPGNNGLEAQVKAAYIYRFAEYVEWPPAAFAGSAAPLVIGVIEDDAVGAELSRLRQTRQIKGRAVAVRTLRAGEATSDIHVLYIGNLDAARMKRALEAAQAQGVLAITDGEGSLSAGSAICLVQVDNRIRFDVSVAHAERNGLKISARLLAVARRIEGGRQ